MSRRCDRRNKVKVLVAMFFAVTFGALGDVSLSRGMKIVAGTEHTGVLSLLASLANVYVIGGVLLMIAFLLLYLASLSWEDLSYVLPLTAADYVLVTIFAHFLLHEDVASLRWVGSILVATGIAFVTRT